MRAPVNSKFIGRWITSLALVLLVIVQTDIHGLASVLGAVPMWFFLATAVAFIAIQLIAAAKWRLLLTGSSWVNLFRLNTVAFFSAFALPSSVSGDITKIVLGRSDSGDDASFAASVIVDRALGFIALFSLLAAAIPFSNLPAVVAFELNWSAILAVTFGICFMMIIIMLIAQRFNLIQRVSGLFRQVLEAISHYKHTPVRLLASFVLSMCFQVATSSTYLLVNLALDINVSFADYVVCLAVLQIGSLLPLSVAGIGLKEVSFITLLGMLGIPSEKSYTAVLIGYPVTLLYAAVGFVLLMRYKRPVVETSIR